MRMERLDDVSSNEALVLENVDFMHTKTTLFTHVNILGIYCKDNLNNDHITSSHFKQNKNITQQEHNIWNKIQNVR